MKISRITDGDIQIDFNGTLQTATTVDGVFVDYDGTSPLKMTPDQDSMFAREKDSDKIVGYINKSIPKGFSIISNPLNNGENKVETVFGDNPGTLTVYRYGDTGFTINFYDTEFEEWMNGDDIINPGEGMFVLNRGDDDVTITFVGEVPQGDLSNALPKGFSLRASQVPQGGKLDSDLGFPTDEGVTVYQFGSYGYSISAYDADFEEWDTYDSNAPVIGVGEGFWVLRSTPTAWTYP